MTWELDLSQYDVSLSLGRGSGGVGSQVNTFEQVQVVVTPSPTHYGQRQSQTDTLENITITTPLSGGNKAVQLLSSVHTDLLAIAIALVIAMQK